jgi:Zn-dependent peptidase ImmA (M78 family)
VNRNAERRAAELLHELRVSGIPVPVDHIVRRLGAQLTFERLPADVSGLLLRDETRQVIAVNSAHARTRQRFSIAHEIGHLRMHKGVFVDTLRVNLRDDNAHRGVDWDEIEANAFAAELLMPKEQVYIECRSLLATGSASQTAMAERLARKFDVSPQAMGIRLVVLGLGLPS